jgi:hypothetical protein
MKNSSLNSTGTWGNKDAQTADVHSAITTHSTRLPHPHPQDLGPLYPDFDAPFFLDRDSLQCQSPVFLTARIIKLAAESGLYSLQRDGALRSVVERDFSLEGVRVGEKEVVGMGEGEVKGEGDVGGGAIQDDLEHRQRRRLSVLQRINSDNSQRVCFHSISKRRGDEKGSGGGSEVGLTQRDSREARDSDVDGLSDLSIADGTEDSTDKAGESEGQSLLLQYVLRKLQCMPLHDNLCVAIPMSNTEPTAGTEGCPGLLPTHLSTLSPGPPFAPTPLLFPTSLTPAMSAWVSMQVRWIVWTLAAHERKNPGTVLL